MNVLNQVLRMLREKQVLFFFFKTLLLIDNALVIQVLQWKKMCSYVLMSPVPLWVP